MDNNRSLKSVRRIIHLLAMLSFIFQVAGVSYIFGQQRSTRQSSVDAFTKGDYELAYREFSELLVTYPKDPLYRYYSGVCLVRLNRSPEEAVLMLQQARQGSAIVRTVPSDVLFWLGRAQQMSGKFDEAIASFNTFTEQYGKKAARDLEIPSYVQQCSDRKGQVSVVAESLLTDEREKKKLREQIVANPEPAAVQKPLMEKEIQKTEKIPANFDMVLSEALDYQLKADSLTRIAEEWKNSLEKLDFKAKTELRTRIAETENLAASFQKRADEKYAQAQDEMNSTSFSAVKMQPRDSVSKIDTMAGKIKISDTVIPDVKASVRKDSVPVRHDTSEIGDISKKVEPTMKKDTSSLPPAKKAVISSSLKNAELFAIFEVKKADNSNAEKIPVNASIPPGLIYRIQVAVFRNPVAISYFKGLSPIYGFTVTGTDKTAYYAGMFRRVADARKALLTVKQTGFRDAFLVALSGGRAVSLDRAAVLEKEWGKKPFIVTLPVMKTPADTIPPELCFRVEVVRSNKPVKDDFMNSIKKIAGGRALDTELLADGTSIYLVGKFITYQSAEEYADLLVRNGYREAKVVARLGEKEVPVETARELFEKVE